MENKTIEKLCKFAFASSIIGVCTIGICPAFGVIGVVVGAVLKSKGVQLDELSAKRINYAFIAGCVSFVFFIVDIILLSLFAKWCF